MCRACLNDWRAGLVGGGSLEDMKRACSEARSPGLPRGLRPPPRMTFSALPGGTRPFWMTDGPLPRKAGQGERCEILGGRWWEQGCVFEMTPAQQRAELTRQLNRLKGSE